MNIYREDTFFKQIFIACLISITFVKTFYMGRILAIDFGKKRTGIAVTDELKIIASGLTTVDTNDLISFLKDYIAKEKVELFVIGKPKQMDNSDSESEQLIMPFINKLVKEIPQIPYKRVDERFTSKMAFQTMIDSGLKKKQRQNKALVDEISATIILQSYLYNQ
ncbi:putative pre-16S rRNA nuclease [Tenacibaculum sp. 190130A14a]|uniref:Putative pre-16S rRNA nuclease n=2 Tax=Tenacibaculum polynesiense TaxID=3137857 RepID=A0ABM9PBP8_9FLAO